MRRGLGIAAPVLVLAVGIGGPAVMAAASVEHAGPALKATVTSPLGVLVR